MRGREGGGNRARAREREGGVRWNSFTSWGTLQWFPQECSIYSPFYCSDAYLKRVGL